MGGPLVFGVLVAVVVLIAFAAIWWVERRRDPVDERLREYASSERSAADAGRVARQPRRRAWLWANRLLVGLGLGPRLASMLTRADLPWTVVEFVMIMIVAAAVGFFLGMARSGWSTGLLLAIVLGCLPLLYARMRRTRRVRAFTGQLPDVLTLLTGALRAGYGLSQAMGMLGEQMPPPASVEFGRVMRAMSLGASVQQALADMGERVGSDDLDLIVTAVTVQYEMGGNLAHTLESIGETVRDRIRILREIRVLTAQQRLTGYVLAALPLFVAAGMFVINRDYILRLLQPGWIRLLPMAAVIMQILGFLIIRRIVDIEV
jgi:tight adherence protein B